VRSAVALLAAIAALSAQAQTIYKCKGADGRITYSSQACAGEGETLSKSGPARTVAEPGIRPAPMGPQPKTCDNGPLLKPVVAMLDSPSTPDDVRAFLASERLRLVRCEYLALSPDELRQRDAAMSDIDSRDASRRKAAMARIAALYEKRPPGTAGVR